MIGFFNRQYTIGELMNIDQGRQQRASQCIVKLTHIYHELKKENLIDRFKSLFKKSIVNTYYVILKFEVTSSSGSSYIVLIRLNPDFDLQDWSNNKIKIYCNCPDFKYRSAYKLNQHNSLFLNDKVKIELGAALSEAPKSKSQTTLLCKHAFAALQWLVGNYSSIMKTI